MDHVLAVLSLIVPSAIAALALYFSRGRDRVDMAEAEARRDAAIEKQGYERGVLEMRLRALEQLPAHQRQEES